MESINKAVSSYIKDGTIDSSLQKNAFRLSAIYYNDQINEIDNRLKVLTSDRLDAPVQETPSSYHTEEMEDLMHQRSRYVQLRLYYQALYESESLAAEPNK